MTQKVDMGYKDKVESSPVNTRLRDIVGGACVLRGFRLQKGSAPFTVSLVRDNFVDSAAITPSGTRVTEDADLTNVLTINFNADPANVRIDSIYMVYSYGAQNATASYTVVEGVAGSGAAAPNPNLTTHTLLGYVTVPANNVDLTSGSCVSVPYGLAGLEVAGESKFHGDATFDKPVTFSSTVTFSDGTTGGGGGTGSTGNASQMDRLSSPIMAAPGQKTFTLTSSYVPNTKTLFVFVDWVPQPPTMFAEDSTTTFSFYDGLKGGEKVWAFWIQDINLYTMVPHNHDDRYYTKQEIADRGPKFFSSTFNGTVGQVLTHSLGTTDYYIASVVPTTFTTDVGNISTAKDVNTITVYNTGSYRGTFDLVYFRNL